MIVCYLLLGIRSYLKLTLVQFKNLLLVSPKNKAQQMTSKFAIAFTVMIGVCFLQPIAAQTTTKTVTGKVTSADNQPIEGASISLKGGAKATSSDKTGKYAISVPANAVLVYSFVGYASKQESVNNRSEINISLVAETKEVDEVVVIGYQTVKRKD